MVKAKVFLRTFGCSANKADSEFMLGLLKERGYEISDSEEDADVIIVNTCGVKTPTEEKVIYHLKRYASQGKRLIVAGCLPRINLERIEREVEGFSAIIDPRSIHKVCEVVDKVLKGEKVIELSEEVPNKLSLPRVLLNPVIGIVPISEGCNMRCSYCCTRFARGRLVSFPPDEIARSVTSLLDGGCKEIHITAQDTASYNFEGKVFLPELLEMVCSSSRRKFFVRVGMMNPFFVKRILKRLVKVYREQEKIFKFLHLPIQSFDDRVLRIMKRFYTTKDVETIVKTFLREIPELTLATDIIVGFPTESEEEFERTLEFLEKYEPDVVNVSKFGARPRTEAAKLPKVDPRIVKERSKRAYEVSRRIFLEKNKRWIGWVGECIVDERGTKENTWIARNFAYKPVVIYSTRNLLGKFVKVKVVGASTYHLKGELIKTVS